MKEMGLLPLLVGFVFCLCIGIILAVFYIGYYYLHEWFIYGCIAIFIMWVIGLCIIALLERTSIWLLFVNKK